MTALRQGDQSAAASVLPRRGRLTPRQARLVRAVTAAVVMVVVAVGMVVRFAAQPSLVTLGLYGVALICSGTAIVLSRWGRTRVAGAVLVAGIAVVVVIEPLVRAGS
ncbi:hypothetical protein JGS22_024210 [Streptomyces sp. P38-E01]|uniref:Uncharacterized protein n=1 Tax=Streptomyces tardus TaxID=2780544 RepID=A0A949JKZ3_9ACTN|nr:hypothetical protein [Streptomyces tardus]MBU7600645.1 hypothetical protein [Streptomyces tardus]